MISSRQILIPLFLLGTFCVCAQGGTNDPVAADPSSLPAFNKWHRVQYDGSKYKLDPKPAKFESWTERMDYLHLNVPRRLQDPVSRVDTFFAREETYREIPSSKFRLGMFNEFNLDDNVEWRPVLDFNADADLPNLKDRFKLFLDSAGSAALPGLAPTERDRSVRVGIRKIIEDMHTRFDAGVRWRLPPDLFVRATWDRVWNAGQWRFGAQQRLFHETDEGLGEMSTLNGVRWFGKDRHWICEGVSALKWTEESGFSWEQTLKVGHISEMIDESWRGGCASRDDVARGALLSFSVFGERGFAERRKLEIAFRRPLRGDWLYVEIVPGIEWARDNNWQTVPKLRIGLDMLFWGTADR
jgi:hypothetical protein